MKRILPHLKREIQPRQLQIVSNPPAEEFAILELEIPRWLFADLCKIQAARGIPLEPLLVGQLENFVVDNWGFSNDGPRKEQWNEQ